MAVFSTTALRKYLTRHSNLGQPLREKAVSTTRAHAEGETLINSGRYRRPLFKSSQAQASNTRRVHLPTTAAASSCPIPSRAGKLRDRNGRRQPTWPKRTASRSLGQDRRSVRRLRP